jgi:tRNA A-37 threonylcarbamoyl transferase component Bud32
MGQSLVAALRGNTTIGAAVHGTRMISGASTGVALTSMSLTALPLHHEQQRPTHQAAGTTSRNSWGASKGTEIYLAEGEGNVLFQTTYHGWDAVVKRAKPLDRFAAEDLCRESSVLRCITAATRRAERIGQRQWAAHFPTWLAFHDATGELVMQRLGGRPLAEFVRQRAAASLLTLLDLQHVLQAVAEILAWLRCQFRGFRHGDLHAANVLVDDPVTAPSDAPLVQIIDFGTAVGEGLPPPLEQVVYEDDMHHLTSNLAAILADYDVPVACRAYLGQFTAVRHLNCPSFARESLVAEAQ